jgi:hypothetical protein
MTNPNVRHIIASADAPDDPVFDAGEITKMAADRSSAVSALPKARDHEAMVQDHIRRNGRAVKGDGSSEWYAKQEERTRDAVLPSSTPPRVRLTA